MEFIKHTEARFIPDEDKLEIKSQAQIEITEGVGEGDTTLEWLMVNGKRFDELLEDSSNNYYNLLADEATHDDAIKEIKNKLYN